MTLEQLIQQYRINSKRVSPQGYANTSSEIPPFLRVLCKYFGLKQFKNMEEFFIALAEAVKNPNMYNSLKTNLFNTVDPAIQQILSNLLMSYFNVTSESYLPAYNNVLMSSLLTSDKTSNISFGTLGSIESTDISKRIASIEGMDFLPTINADISASVDSDLIGVILPLLILGAQTTQNGQMLLNKAISTLFKMLMCTDGYSDMSNILKIMKDKASLVAENIEEISKSASGISFDVSSINANKKKLLSMSTMAEQFQIIEQLCMTSVQELMQLLSLDQQTAQVIYGSMIELIKINLPSILIEDLPATLKYESVKTSSGEARKLHLNSLFVAQAMLSIGLPSVTSFLIGYVVTSLSYKSSPAILDTMTDVSHMVVTVLSQFGLGSLNNRVPAGSIVVGDVSLKNCIKYDIYRKTNALTLMYASINNDVNLQAFASTVMSRPELNVYNMINEIAKRYPAVVKGKRYTTLSVELMDNYLASVGLSSFTTSVNPKLKDVVMTFTDIMASTMREIEESGVI